MPCFPSNAQPVRQLQPSCSTTHSALPQQTRTRWRREQPAPVTQRSRCPDCAAPTDTTEPVGHATHHTKPGDTATHVFCCTPSPLMLPRSDRLPLSSESSSTSAPRGARERFGKGLRQRSCNIYKSLTVSPAPNKRAQRVNVRLPRALMLLAAHAAAEHSQPSPARPAQPAAQGDVFTHPAAATASACPPSPRQ